ncbi:MAG: hydrolase [Deltaproteobacteria bacterium]|nr:hydrolase [Deltaproteobacteria bacterium]
MLKIENTALIIVDIQGNLALAMHEKELLFRNVRKLIKGIQVLGIPILWTEQIPQKLGPTIPEIADLMSGIHPVSKLSFSCCQDETFLRALKALDRKQILISGIEAHICVYQTTADLIDLGHEVQVVTDAVSSRNIEDKLIGLQRMRDSGASLTSVETSLFELLKTAEAKHFKEILNIVK